MLRSDAYNLFVQTLNIVNAAIVSHKGRKPYRQMLAAYERLFGTRDLVVAIDVKGPGQSVDYVTIRLERAQFVIVAHGNCGRDADWRVPEEYLRQVNANPQFYAEHPASLTWDWVKSRVGKSQPSPRESKEE